MAVIDFLRHGETEYNKKGIFAGRIDCGLSAEGLAACKALAERDWPPYAAIYCSPLKRARQTLEAVFPGSTPRLDERILEICIGAWEGREKSTLDPKEVRLYQQGLLTPPKGEAPEAVDRRVISFVTELFERYEETSRVLVVTHNGILRTIKRNFVEKYETLASKNLEIVTLTQEDYLRYQNKKINPSS